MSLKSWFLAALLSVLAVCSSCAHSEQCVPPDWFERPRTVASDEAFAAAGVGRTQEKALDHAQRELAKTISSRVTSTLEIRTRLRQEDGSEYSSRSIEEATQVVAELVLRSVEAVASRKVCDRYYAAVAIPRAEARAQLTEQDTFLENIKLALEGRMDALEEAISRTTARISAIETAARSNAERISSAERVLAHLEEQMRSSAQRSAEIGGLEAEVAELRDKLEAAQRAPSSRAEEEAFRDLEETEARVLLAAEALEADLRGDYLAARLGYQKLCASGRAASCNNLGFLYQHGSGVAKDLSRARALYEQSCEMGAGIGCANLGFLYGTGSGVAKDPSRARALYDQGCEMGDGLGCANLGFLYQHGSGVAKDLSLARALYEQSCEMGDGTGCMGLGILYREAKDLSRARALFEQGCELGVDEACKLLNP